MTKILKLSLSAIGALLLLMIAIIIAIVFMVNPNDYKSKINQQISQKIGREFAIRGDINWTFFPWLGLQAQDIYVSNAKGFDATPFASIKAMNIKMKLLPLLHKQIEIGKIGLEGARLNLQKDKSGQSNWQGMIAQKTEANTTSASLKGEDTDKKVDVSISEIILQDANVTWADEQAGQHLILSRLNLKTGNLRASEYADVKMSGNFNSKQPKLAGNFKLTGQVQADNNKYSAKKLALDLQLLDKSYQNGKLNININTDIVANVNDGTFVLDNLLAKIANLQLSGKLSQQAKAKQKVLAGDLQVPDFNLKQFLQAAGKTELAKNAPQKVNAKLRLNTGDTIELGHLQLNLDDTSIVGKVNIQDIKTNRLYVQLNANKFNLSDYMTADKDAKSIKLTAINYAGTATLTDADKKTLIQRLIANGNLRIGTLQYDKTKISNITALINANQGLVKLSPVNAQVYQGKYVGNLSVDMRQAVPAIIAEQSFTGINLAQLLNDFKPISIVQVSGTSDLKSTISAAGDSADKIRRSLTGKVNFAVNKGTLKGINLEHWLNVGSALYHREPVPSMNAPNETNFQQLTGSFNINKGIARNDDFILQSTLMRVTGQGTVDLVNEQINYLFIAVKMNPANNQPRKDVIPIRVSGPFANISVKPDVEQLLRNQVQKEVGNQLEKHLGKETADKLRKLNLDKLFGR